MDRKKTGKKSISKKIKRLKENSNHFILAQCETNQIFSSNEKMFQFLWDNMKEIIIFIDKRGKIIYANKAALRSSGYTEKELFNQSIIRFLTPVSRKRALRALKQEFLGQAQPEMEIAFKAKNGDIRTLKVAAGSAPIHLEGKLVGIMICASDITEIKKVSEKLRESELRFRSLWENAPVAYHILDTKGIIKDVNNTEAMMLGYSREELIGRPIFDFILPEQREEAKKRFEMKISGQSVPKAEKRIYLRKDGTRIIVDINDVLERDVKGRIVGIRTAMIDITERKKAEEKIRQMLESQKKLLLGLIQAISLMVEFRDPYTAGHQKRVAELASSIATEMGLPPEKIDSLRIAALLHDVGKIAVPSEILSKPGKLNEFELNLIRSHVEMGYEILKPIEFPWHIKEIIRQHHERLDGSGYPYGLRGDEIILEARILAVADVLEAMTSNRPYRPSYSLDQALEELLKHSGKFYDREVIATCIKLFKEKNFSFNHKESVF